MTDTSMIDSVIDRGELSTDVGGDPKPDDTGGENAPDQSTPQKTGADEGKSEATTDAQKTDASGKGSVPSAGTKPKDQQAKKPEGSSDIGPNDLRLKDGTVIKAGPERRWYQEAQNARRELQNISRERDELRARAEAFAQAFRPASELGISPQEANVALRLMAQWKKDPTSAINYLIAEARAMGHNLKDLGGSSVDAQAIERILDKKFGPILQREQESSQQQRAIAQARQQIDDFFNSYPEYQVHEKEIHDTIRHHHERTGQLLGLREAGLMLERFFAQRGLDFSVPLSEHARREAENRGTETKPNAPSRGIPNGRNGGSSQMQTHQPSMAAVDDSYESIVRRVMREQGLKA